VAVRKNFSSHLGVKLPLQKKKRPLRKKGFSECNKGKAKNIEAMNKEEVHKGRGVEKTYTLKEAAKRKCRRNRKRISKGKKKTLPLKKLRGGGWKKKRGVGE